MKKLIILLSLVLVTGVMLSGQSGTITKKNFTIYKGTPTFSLMGTGGVINFNSGDITLTNSTNTLTMAGGNFVIDGTVAISGVSLLNPRFATIVTNTDESETLTAAQSGVLVTTDGAATITIPDPSAATVGVIYYIMQTADANLILTATTATGNSFVCNGVATSDNVTISTASHKIGSGMIVIGISATQWYVGGLNPESLLIPEAAD